MAIARLLYPAEGHVCLCADRRRVHVGDAVVKLRERPESSVHILCVDRGREPVPHAVVHRERLVQRRNPDYREHWTENFLLLDRHSSLDVRKDRRLEEIAPGQPPTLGPCPAADEVCSFLDANVYITLDLFNIGFID